MQCIGKMPCKRRKPPQEGQSGKKLTQKNGRMSLPHGCRCVRPQRMVERTGLHQSCSCPRKTSEHHVSIWKMRTASIKLRASTNCTKAKWNTICDKVSRVTSRASEQSAWPHEHSCARCRGFPAGRPRGRLSHAPNRTQFTKCLLQNGTRQSYALAQSPSSRTAAHKRHTNLTRHATR